MSDQRYIASIIRKDALKLFGKLLRALMEKADINQVQLEARSLAQRKAWADQGFFKEAESGDLTQSSISQAINGKLRRPSYGQIFIWLYIVEEALKAKGYDFPKDFKDDMFHLACYVPPDEVINAYKRLSTPKTQK